MLDQLHHNHAHGAVLDRVDPRLRIVVALSLSVVVALADRFAVLGAALAAVLVAFVLSGQSPAVLRRLLPLNVVMLVLLVMLPMTTAGLAVLEIGPVTFSREGCLLAAALAIKGNTIVLALLSLLGTLDAVTLGHAMSHLRLPDKLTRLMLFTVRYLDVLHREYRRLRWAMKVRAFRPGMNRHTYRSLGYLAGMLLVRSFDRSERIVAAMKCRGFAGRFYVLHHFHFTRYDWPFAAVSIVVVLLLVWGQWL